MMALKARLTSGLNSIAVRVGLAITVALLAMAGFGAAIIHHRSDIRPVFFDPDWVQGEAIIARQRFDAAPREERDRVAQALSNEWILYEWIETPRIEEPPRSFWPIEPLRSKLSDRFGDAAFRIGLEVPIIAIPMINREPSLVSVDPEINARRPIPGIFMIDLQLSDGSWIAMSSRLARRMARLRNRGIIFAVLAALTIVGAAYGAARFMSGPINSFSQAAYRLGVDPQPKPLPDAGPSELRRATKAFNAMQERIARFVSDRTMLLAAISHDLRTPLTRLRLRVEAVEDDDLKGRLVSDLDQMDAMLRTVLDFARDQHQQEPRGKLDMAALLITIADEFQDTQADVDYRGPDRLAYTGRAGALKRLFDNLVDNAVRYGGGARIDLHRGPQGLLISVQDSGPGIPEDRLAQVMEPFVRLDDSRNQETGGTGLGLTIARSIARQHGGELVLANRPEGGLKATVDLPL